MKTKFMAALMIGAVLLLPKLLCAEKVSFTSEDGVRLQGEFYKPQKPRGTAVILLHGVAAVKWEWQGFAELLQSKGYGVLIYDQRGHGESMSRASGEKVDFQTFYGQGLSSEWGKMIPDLDEAVKFLKKQYAPYAGTIVVGGASIGANIALRYAVSHPEVPYAVLLSPGLSYMGITTDDAIKAYGIRPLVIAVCPSDLYAYRSTNRLKDVAEPGTRVSVFLAPEGAGHGVQMFKRVPSGTPSGAPSALEQKLLNWMNAQEKRK